MADGVFIKVKKPRKTTAKIFQNMLRDEVLPAFKKKSIEIANEMRDDLISLIHTQSFPAGADYTLSARYKKRKIRYGYDPRVFMASSLYVNSIIVIETEMGAKIGVEDKMHPPLFGGKDLENGPARTRGGKFRREAVPMDVLADWLEYGTFTKDGKVKMKPRPHWRPIIDKYTDLYGTNTERFETDMAEAMVDAIDRQLQGDEVKITITDPRGK